MNIDFTAAKRSVALATALVAAPFAAQAAEYIHNGTFATNGGVGQVGTTTTVAGWSAGGTEGVFGPSNAPVFLFPSSGAAVTAPSMGTVAFYETPQSPTGDYYIAAHGDSDYHGSISQSVSGLTVGTSYTLSFDWAGAQQTGYGGPTTEQWGVYFGSNTQFTSLVNTDALTFSEGWQHASMNFTASSATQQLTFLAIGANNGQAPWLLLNDVSLTETAAPTTPVPEPESALMMAVGLFGIAGARLRARRSSKSAA